jgi:hypothetical protein
VQFSHSFGAAGGTCAQRAPRHRGRIRCSVLIIHPTRAANGRPRNLPNPRKEAKFGLALSHPMATHIYIHERREINFINRSCKENFPTRCSHDFFIVPHGADAGGKSYINCTGTKEKASVGPTGGRARSNWVSAGVDQIVGNMYMCAYLPRRKRASAGTRSLSQMQRLIRSTAAARRNN